MSGKYKRRVGAAAVAAGFAGQVFLAAPATAQGPGFVICDADFPYGPPYAQYWSGVPYVIASARHVCGPPGPDLWHEWLWVQYRPTSGVPWSQLLPNAFTDDIYNDHDPMTAVVLCPRNVTYGYRGELSWAMAHGNTGAGFLGGPIASITCS